ncbi:WD40-repeat-containing domain protein [Zychaea mexicana]|uniref:WD40-repeat-containing domain protein n=1 Tax=Zychaea mexicana TaxID=64656 RepID=UPI0022FE5554|nr:WD40-repeat-containing domain protein [Zychaea mexicana]KAI9479514.1 WD40-repeat-containing domain protein [Zychaea mexicana]
MGKKTFKANPDTATVATSATTAVSAGILFSAFDESPSAEFFALVTHNIGRHQLRIFNTRSGTVSNDFSSENKESFTSLSWGNVVDTGDLAKAGDSKVNKRRKSHNTTKAVALGTNTGTIVIYSLAHGSIVKRLTSAHTTPVTDFVLNKAGTKGYSVAEDNYIVEWDIVQEKETAKWKANEKSVRRLALSHDETKLAVAGHTISLWNLHDQKVFKKFTGHASAVKELRFSSQDDILVSIGDDDRYVNVWDAQSTNDNTNNLTALTLENNVIQIDFSETESSVLAVSEDGSVGVWQNASSPAMASGPKNRRKMARATTKQPDSTITVVSSTSEEETIPVISANFVTDNDSKAVMIARGSSIKPSFEVVQYVNEESGAVMDNIVLTRQAVVNNLVSNGSMAANNLKTTQKAYNEAAVKVIGNTDFAMRNPTAKSSSDGQVSAEPSLEQRLNEMGVNEEKSEIETKKRTNKPSTPSAGSLQQVLLQALHSGDKALLEACLAQEKPEIIQTTIQRLPTAYVIPLMLQLIAKFQTSPGRGTGLLVWIKAVLLTHTTYLMTVPDLVAQLSTFYQALDSRLAVFPKLLALRGRLDLIQNQINNRSRYSQNEDGENGAVGLYVEEDSDEEAEQEEAAMSEDEVDEYVSEDEEMLEMEDYDEEDEDDD